MQQGPTGANGPTGPSGPTGAQGPTGPSLDDYVRQWNKFINDVVVVVSFITTLYGKTKNSIINLIK